MFSGLHKDIPKNLWTETVPHYMHTFLNGSCTPLKSGPLPSLCSVSTVSASDCSTTGTDLLDLHVGQ
jgi:hypothetical protein